MVAKDVEINSFDVLGNIALVKFDFNVKSKYKKKAAEVLLERHKSIKTVLEKVGKFSGRLRKQETKWLAGEKTNEVLYRENGCVFRFNIDDTYFSPRLSSERKEISEKVKKGDKVFVMFAGVGPYSIVIAKNSSASEIYSNEINRKANKYAEQNIELNKLKGRVVLLPGDVKKVVGRLKSLSRPPSQKHASLTRRFVGSEEPRTPAGTSSSLKKIINAKNPLRSAYDRRGLELAHDTLGSRSELLGVPSAFDVIVMPRPRLKDSFLKEAFALSRGGRKGTRIFYYDFCKHDEIDDIVEKVRREAKEAGKKIKILNVKRAGEIAPYKFRIRIDFRVL